MTGASVIDALGARSNYPESRAFGSMAGKGIGDIAGVQQFYIAQIISAPDSGILFFVAWFSMAFHPGRLILLAMARVQDDPEWVPQPTFASCVYSDILAGMPKLSLSDKTLELVARRFRYLGEPFRLRILQALSGGEKTVGELVEALDGNQPNVSKHLQLMLTGGLVSRRKDGTSSYYAIADPLIFTLCDLVCRSATEKTRGELKELQTSAARKR